MISKKEISDFAEFCFNKYGFEIHGFIIEDYLQSFYSENQTVNEYLNENKNNGDECGSNNISCTYIAIDSAKCNKCPN